MKHSFLILLAALPLLAVASPIPSAYYDDAQGKKDEALKTALHTIIQGGERYEYGTNQYHSSSNPPEWEKGDFKTYGTWYAFPVTDIRSDGTVWDMYSNTRRFYPVNRGESGCALNIEHCFPKSWWGGTENDAYKDLYHLNPSDAQANQTGKNAYPAGIVDSLIKFDNGSFKQGFMKGHSFRVFEPADCYKGDFARAWFYIVTAYEDFEWQGDKALDAMDNTSYLEFQPWLTDVLLAWHRQDPVSPKEIDRAAAIYDIQHNRNPFIDYPELVEYIWGNKKGEEVDFETMVGTFSSEYTPKQDFLNFKALPATDITTESFTAEWSDFATGYTIDVYTRSWTGENDTIINLPAVTKNLVEGCPYGKVEGKIQSNGSAAATMGSGSTDGTIIFSGFQLHQDAELVIRASQYNTAKSAQLNISANGDLIKTIDDISRDETVYRIDIPLTTTSISIASIGGKTEKRACIQAVFLIEGDLKEVKTSLEGYPKSVTEHSEIVVLPEESTDSFFYYRVETDGGIISNEVEVCVERTTEDLSSTEQQQPVEKQIIDGRLFILRQGKRYSALGVRE